MAHRERRRKNLSDPRRRASTAKLGPATATRVDVPTGENFAACYMELCKRQGVRPLPVICVTLPHCLDFTTDRVKMDDWGPILNSLSLDRSLRSISIRSRYQSRKPLEEINSEDKVRTMGKAPVVLSRYLLEWLSHSVAQCVRNSPVLASLELEGIPLPADCLASLCVGLAGTTSLQRLSLQRCYIGDNSCELVCRTVADVQSVRSLNLSQCDLSGKSGVSLATALSRQKLSLYHDTWKESLRYREPNLEAMPGLRRLTLNGNPRLGDAAVSELIEAIRDSLWLKALDLQHCGLTNAVGEPIVHLLENNKTISIIDVRMNPGLDEDTMRQIYHRLEINNAENGRSDYRWLSLPQKDNRRNVVSAGNGSRCVAETLASRPKSAFVPSGARRPASVAKNLPVARARRRDKPAVAETNKIEKQAIEKIGEDENREKIALRVDLCAQMTPGVEDARNNDEEGNSVDRETLESAGKPEVSRASSVDLEELARVLQQLSEARMEHDRLVDENRRAEALLSEERVRRESAEAKLESMERNLAELESALKRTESETRGFVLISERMLEEMAESYNWISNALDEAARSSNNKDQPDAMEDERRRSDYSRMTSEMRRREFRSIRKTKSASHDRGLLRIECEETSVIQASAPSVNPRKLAKSEGNVRDALPPIVQPIRLERNIGDSPDVARQAEHETPEDDRESSSLERKKISSPCARARARALFAQIVNGEPFVHLGAHGS